MKKWDYMTLICADFQAEAKLKAAGKDGWELVAVVKSDVGDKTCYFYLKREIA